MAGLDITQMYNSIGQVYERLEELDEVSPGSREYERGKAQIGAIARNWDGIRAKGKNFAWTDQRLQRRIEMLENALDLVDLYLTIQEGDKNHAGEKTKRKSHSDGKTCEKHFGKVKGKG